MTNELIPISEEQAKALQEGFKLAGQSIELARQLGGYLGGVLGSVPEDLVGLLGGDWLRVRRAENVVGMIQKAQNRLNARNVRAIAAPLSVALPLLQAAADEDREQLVDMWARLLAAALDPARRNAVRRQFIDIVSSMEPLDALVFSELQNLGSTETPPHQRFYFSSRLNFGENEVEVAMMHLIELRCARNPQQRDGITPANVLNLRMTAIGVELKRVLAN